MPDRARTIRVLSPGTTDEEVVRLDVAMRHPYVVQMCETRRRIARDHPYGVIVCFQVC